MGFWWGQLEFGEEIREAVLREVKEEYGVNGEIQEQLPSYSLLRVQGGIKTHWVVAPFFIKVDLKKVKIMEPEKATEIGIFTLDNLPQPLHNGIKITMSQYKESFEKYKNYQ